MALSLSTSGPDPVRDRLESVAALKFQGGRVLERFEGPAMGLPAFLGDAPLVGHDLPQALAFLAAQGIQPGSLRWDVQELGGILLPQARDLTLAGLARLLLQEGAASATDAAETTRLVYLALLERAKEVQPAVLQRMAGLASHSPGSLGLLLSALAETTHAVAAGVPGGLDYRALAKRLERPRSLRPSQRSRPSNPKRSPFCLVLRGL